MRFIWPDSARSDMRAIDRQIAIRILHGCTEFGESRKGDLKALAGTGKDTLDFESGPDRLSDSAGENHDHACSPSFRSVLLSSRPTMQAGPNTHYLRRWSAQALVSAMAHTR